MNQRNFFAELKQRNVIRAAGLYLVGAWLLTQVAGTVLPMFGAPDWLPRSIVILFALEFIPALIFSWAFELTPRFESKTYQATNMRRQQSRSNPSILRFIIFIVALVGTAQAIAAQRTDKIFIQGNPAGTQTIQAESSGAVRAEYSYNDRGRGDHIIATWKVDGAGVPSEYEGRG